MKTKNELEQAIVMHEEALESSKHSVIVDTQDLEQAKKELADFNKPIISSEVMDVINDAVNEAIEGYNFDDADQYELDFSLDYDGRIQAETINLRDTYELMEAIVTKVEKQFKIKQYESTDTK